MLKTLGGAAAVGMLGPRVVGASPMDERFIVDAGTVEMNQMSGMEVVHDLREAIGYAVVRGSESSIPSAATYARDIQIEIDRPAASASPPAIGTAHDQEEPLYDLQWDKREQDIDRIHRFSTGEGARIGIIDDGVLGANPDSDAAHPDLPNVRPDLSKNFTGDGNGPGPLGDDHGTHVAGTAAGARNDQGIVGMAPDAEIVGLRVFSGQGAAFGDIIAAITYGARVDCDVLNLSLGTPPFLPLDNPPEEIGSDDDPDGDGPITPVNAQSLAVVQDAERSAAQFALDQGALPVASAGNDGVDLDAHLGEPIEVELDSGATIHYDGTPVALPASVEGFMSVGATGPIGYGWPIEGEGDEVGPYEIEHPIRTELPTYEPALYTNYGAEDVDVTCGGGNADTDAQGEVDNWFFDLVLATTFRISPDAPEDERLDQYTPSYGWKAGTSFAAPNVSGIAALMAAVNPNASPERIREYIEATARSYPVGRFGETTAPGESPNESSDGDYDGDRPSSPGDNPGYISPYQYRGEGHVQAFPAVLVAWRTRNRDDHR